MGDERLNMSGSSTGFPLVSRPDFGAYTLSSSRSECGGLGSHGLSVLAARSQFGTLSGWFVEESRVILGSFRVMWHS